MKKQKSFTLIEVLVVVAVIGLLGSIILVSTKGAREKAKITRLLQFSGSVHHTLGAYAVGIWNFNEDGDNTCPGGEDLCDWSGNNNHGTNNGIGRQDHDTPQLKQAFRKTGKLEGGDYYAEIVDSDELDGMHELTIEMWIKMSNVTSTQYLFKKDQSYELKYSADGTFTFTVWWSSGTRLIEYTEQRLDDGKWHHLVWIYYGGDVENDNLNLDLTYFIDAKERPRRIGLLRASFNINNADSSLFLGCNHLGEECFNGFLDEVHIYRGALTYTQIRKHYTEGLKRHKNYSIKK